MNPPQAYSLHQLNEYIKRVISLNFAEPVWIEAEVGQWNESRGHQYLTLIDKLEEEQAPRAQAAANLWAQTFKRWNADRKKIASHLLQSGMKVKLHVQPHYHVRYGLSLNILDIDTAYSMGKLAQQRQQVLDNLQSKGLIGKNAEIELPLVLQRIAIISSETAAGLQDFVDQLSDNSYGYYFECVLFDAVMQGGNAAEDIISQMEEINSQAYHFDCVVMVRGGGSSMDLLAFDDEKMCEKIADCKLPVIVGIGHDIDNTVADQVAHSSLKTPTAVADFIIHHTQYFEEEMLMAYNGVQQIAQQALQAKSYEIKSLESQIPALSGWQIKQKGQYLANTETSLKSELKRYVNALERRLSDVEDKVNLLDPKLVLSRGYTITQLEAKAINEENWPIEGQLIQTVFKNGKILSKVEKSSIS